MLTRNCARRFFAIAKAEQPLTSTLGPLPIEHLEEDRWDPEVGCIPNFTLSTFAAAEESLEVVIRTLWASCAFQYLDAGDVAVDDGCHVDRERSELELG